MLTYFISIITIIVIAMFTIEQLSTRETTVNLTTQASQKNKEQIEQAMKKGRKPWGRSKIMIVGEGRAGKTALSNSIIGKPFEDTESTVGINQLTFDVKYTSLGQGTWNEYVKPEKEFEAAIASMVMIEDSNRDTQQERTSNQSNQNADTVNKENTPSSPSSSSLSLSEVAMIRNNNVTNHLDVNHTRNDSKQNKDKEFPPVDEDLVMKCLSDSVQSQSKVILSLFDFGGQSVFDIIHHFFLTKYGVYILVFRMDWILSSDQSLVDRCFSLLSFWMNSITVHTLDPSEDTVAPIVMVGTRKDEIHDIIQHQQISILLDKYYSRCKAWVSVLENENEQLCFFPVNNKLGRQDPTVVNMMTTIEKVVEKANYVIQEKPLNWFRALDKIQSIKKPYLFLDVVISLTKECNIDDIEEIYELLSFLHEMGILMWHNEIGLKEVVILDAIKYFVTPITRIICKHTADPTDPTVHLTDLHKLCRKQHRDDWELMISNGILSVKLFQALLPDRKEHVGILLLLMMKFKLLVVLEDPVLDDYENETDHRPSKPPSFLIPALLPSAPEAALTDVWTSQTVSTCYLIFTTKEKLMTSPLITSSDLQSVGFLPRGLMERFLGRAITWCQQTSHVTDIRTLVLYKDLALLSYGNQRFRIQLLNGLNSIRVEIEGLNPLAIHSRLEEQASKAIAESMRSLVCFTALPYVSVESMSSSIDSIETTQDMCWVPLQQIREVKHDRPLRLLGGRQLIADEIRLKFGNWIPNNELLSHYDIFISYRWGPQDSSFSQALFDNLSNFTIGSNNRAINVFLDSKRLKDGINFQSAFGKALIHTVVVIPIVSYDALEKMISHDIHTEDNVLIEWLLLTECLKQDVPHIKAVIPIFFGKFDSSGSFSSNLFDSDIMNKLPAVVPEACVRRVQQLLAENNMSPSTTLQSCTIRSIVTDLRKFLGVKGWEANARLVTRVCRKVVETLSTHAATSSTNHPPGSTATANLAQKQPTVIQQEDKSNTSLTNDDGNERPSLENSVEPRQGDSGSKALGDLTIEEVGNLMQNMKTGVSMEDIRRNFVDGEILRAIESLAEFDELQFTMSRIRKQQFFSNMQKWKSAGVPMELIK